METVWIRTEDDLYQVEGKRFAGAMDLLAFASEICADGVGPIDVPTLAPYLGVETAEIHEEEWAALEHAEVWVGDPGGLRPFCLCAGEGAVYAVEIHLRDGRADVALGDLRQLYRLCSLVTEDSAVPTVYTDGTGALRIVTPWDLIDLGCIYYLGDLEVD